MPEEEGLPRTLADLQAVLLEDRSVVADRFVGRTAAELNWKPASDGWSVAQCLHHLVITDALYLERLEPVLATVAPDPEADLSSKILEGSPFGRWFARLAGPTSRRRFKAPKRFRPSVSELPASVPDELLHEHDRLAALLLRAPGSDLEKLKITSPVTRLLRFRVSDALRLVVMHDRRHILQALRVLDSPRHPIRPTS